ncbi:MAG: protein-disulfide reductase DsbD family protein [Salinivirgaceae bacterium]
MKKLMRILWILTVIVTMAQTVQSQVLQPVKWKFETKQISDTEYELLFKASIEKNWHLYAQWLPEGNFSLPTQFIFESTADVELIDTVTSLSTVHEAYEELAGAMSRYYDTEAVFLQKIKIIGDNPQIKGLIDYMTCDDEQCIKLDEEFEFNFNNTAANSVEIDETTTQPETGGSLWAVIIEAILWGFAALLTPCVFPMVPMTVSFFMKGSQNKAKGRLMASTYGFSIVFLYTFPIAVMIGITYFIGGESIAIDVFNWLSTHWIPNVLFFLIFMLFAASFFGAFEIVLPSSWVNKADSKVDKGGLIGAFFMAVTLVLVSFSCTGPIVSSVIVKSTQGAIWEPIITMFAFSAAFALPFTLFAFFPSWLNKLPKSGGWLNSVKVVLGFIEVALGFKFLSVADQTYHWGILDREIYLAIWIVTFTLLGLYLLGKIKFAHDSEVKFLSVPRLAMAMSVFVFVVYLIPGMFGAPLKGLSGYLPPQATMDFDIERIVRDNATNQNYITDTPLNKDKNELCEKPKYGDFLHLPHGIKGYFDYEQGLACAKAQNKPVFIDFTGHGCVNCREMEARVWSDPEVLKRLNNDYVVIALYVDDKTKLPEDEWVTSSYDGKLKKSIGKKYADFQITKFNINAQPYYCLLDHEGELLTKPKAYDLNIDAFVEFLDKGVEEFKKRNKKEANFNNLIFSN